MTAEPVSPQEANLYYEQKAEVPIQASGDKDETDLPVSVMSSAAEATIEITELARALQHNPKLIYDYVHNHIDYVPYFGSLKGATLTYLDGSGNDFDQASLMIALLRAGGYTANYQYGTMVIPRNDLLNWLGIDDIDDVVAGVIGSGGIPGEILANGDINMMRVWVKAAINSTDYLFDPAFKFYEYTEKIDIGIATGYNRADLLNAATAGANVTGDYVQNLNEGNLNNKLAEYAANMVDTLRTQYPNSEVKEIVGGRSIVQANLNQYQTTLPFSTVVYATWTDISQGYTAKLRIRHQGINHNFEVPEIAGKRLTLTYTGSNFIPELRLDNSLIASGNSTTEGRTYDLIVTIDHPYAYDSGRYMDQTSTYNVVSNATYAVISDFGGTNNSLINKRQKELNQSLADGIAESSEEVRGETLNVMGLTWMKETKLADQLTAKLAETPYPSGIIK